ncbi:hypothetical protein ASG17_03790 [Brevundimonas sp. Leaf363]|uniref:hypothetical protein n=1 Tax=Brevundimonas sp. Leaf363 TaxID=1736353 RepID=UPI0006F86997|nr:hypothetical protein [Brevundimonas sp. Leaf363]KQS55225.1 hypothetical protein ASG17_03790 [Brevundimonas sp. Leaf363]
MRRFLVWSALAALVGLILAGGGYWAYWNFYARFQPVTITRNQAEIQRLLDEASWVSDGGGGQPLYVVGYRDSASTMRYDREETPKLRAGGVETRVILFARDDREGQAQSTPAERATIAELWLTRDWTLYQRWTATPARNWTAAGIPQADGNLARRAVVDASRQFNNRLNELLSGAGIQPRYPIILWRDREGFLKACACSDSRSWTFIRDDLGAPDRIDPVTAQDAPVPPAVTPGDGSPETLPYPNLPPIPGQTPPMQPGQTQPVPALPGQVQPGSPAQPGQATPRPSRPTQPSAPPSAPAPQKSDDTTFF